MLNRPKIIRVIPHQDFSLEINLSDHRHLWLSMKRFLKSTAYKKLSDIGFFLSVKHDHRLIYWDDSHDMHIDQILDFSTVDKKELHTTSIETLSSMASIS